jgi:hypothetical protein
MTDQAGTSFFGIASNASGYSTRVAITSVTSTAAGGTACGATAGLVTVSDSNGLSQVTITNARAILGGIAFVSFASTTGLAATTAVRSVVVGNGSIVVTVTAAFSANNAVLSFFLLNAI